MSYYLVIHLLRITDMKMVTGGKLGVNDGKCGLLEVKHRAF